MSRFKGTSSARAARAAYHGWIDASTPSPLPCKILSSGGIALAPWMPDICGLLGSGRGNLMAHQTKRDKDQVYEDTFEQPSPATNQIPPQDVAEGENKYASSD